MAWIGIADLDFENGDLDEAESKFQVGVEMGKIWSAWECLLPGMTGLARIRAARGDWTTAYAILDELVERTAANAFMVCPAIEAMRAAFQLKQGDLASAAHWASTFDADHPSTYRLQWEQNALIAAQIWLAEGRQLEAEILLNHLVVEANSAGRLKVLQQIHNICPTYTQPSRQAAKTSGLPESLSERELEVLRLMAAGLSNPEIARKLYLSPNTLKAHAQNIYLKLDVHNRMEAVTKARSLNLF
jgi:LuxR family maltose regulon positive regulatory protein